MEIGLIGLGKMGYPLALNMKDHGHRVVAYNRSLEKVRLAEKEGIVGAFSIEVLVLILHSPRVIWLMLPAGPFIDETF